MPVPLAKHLAVDRHTLAFAMQNQPDSGSKSAIPLSLNLEFETGPHLIISLHCRAVSAMLGRATFCV